MSELTLSEFLLARIAEDEAMARAAESDWWLRLMDGLRSNWQPRLTDHIARHDPARVLAECDAKRRIVEMHPHRFTEGDGRLIGDEWECRKCLGPSGWCSTLRALAAVYADHPDYREAVSEFIAEGEPTPEAPCACQSAEVRELVGPCATSPQGEGVGSWHPDHPDRVAARAERDTRRRDDIEDRIAEKAGREFMTAQPTPRDHRDDATIDGGSVHDAADLPDISPQSEGEDALRERIARAIEAQRTQFALVTNTPLNHPVCRAYTDAARIARTDPTTAQEADDV